MNSPAGSLAPKVLQKVCDENVSHEAFAFMTAKDIRVGYAPVVAYRAT